MAILDYIRRKAESVGGVLVAVKESAVQDAISSSSIVADGLTRSIVAPDVPFATAFEYYKTIGKVQNAVDTMVSKIITRDWYFSPVQREAASKYDSQIQKLEQWELDFNLSLIFEYMIRDWLLTGNCLLGKTDWRPVQLSNIAGLVRDKNGVVLQYIFSLNGQSLPLMPDKFLHTKWVDCDRAAWGVGSFHAIFNSNWYDSDVKRPKSTAAIIRVMEQDTGKIHHKFAAPRVIYGFDNVNKEVFDRDIAPLISSQQPGDRLALSKMPQLLMESVDGKARFTDSIDLINSELDAGLQSSANPNLAKPGSIRSGGAEIGNKQDDERSLAVMEKIRRVMNTEIIPLVLGQQFSGVIEFVWGKQDDFDYNANELQTWVELGALSKYELREILKREGVYTSDELFQKDQQEKQDQLQQFQKMRSGGGAGGTVSQGSDARKVGGQAEPSGSMAAKATESMKAEVQKTVEEALKKLEEFEKKK